ncbi:S8 family serine peptidase [bacterium]|nr:S8 family serine peptidase [bacterium]
MFEEKTLYVTLTFFFGFSVALADPGLIRLTRGTIDPASSYIMSLKKPVCSPSATGTRLYIVQPEKNFIPSEREAVKEIGIRFQGNIPPNAYIVEATEKGIVDLKSAFPILYIGEFLPEYKLLYNGNDETYFNADGHKNWKHVQIGAVRKEYIPDVIRALNDIGAKEIGETFSTLEPCVKAYATNDQVKEIARRGDVAFIEPYSESEVFNDVARSEIYTNIDALQMKGYNGKGQMICVQDTGLDNGTTNNIHPDFLGKKIIGRNTYGVYRKRGNYYDWNDSYGHGTHVTGTALGTGKASDGQYRGMACDADVYCLCAGVNGDEYYEGTQDDLEKTYESGCRVMNNSWGRDKDGQYTSGSRLYDQLVWDHKDYTVCFSAGNGNRKEDLPTEIRLAQHASAKNVITVGASDVPYLKLPDSLRRGMALFSSRGPCQDGRIKPDVVAPGENICSTLASQDKTSVREDYYCKKSGTSMATPVVAGAAAIIREYLIKNRRETSPSAALVKAILCVGAYSLYPGKHLEFEEIPFLRPNQVEGHGHINVKESLEPTEGELLFAEMSLSKSGEAVTNVFNKSADCDLNVGLVWTDYPGTAGAAKALVNDLDLYVVAPDGKVYCLYDHLNNVEIIRMYNVPSGDYKVIVKANTIMEADQPCAVVFHYRNGDHKVPLDVDAKPFGLNSSETQWIIKNSSSAQTINYTAKLTEGADKFEVVPASGSFINQTSITIRCISDSNVRGYDWGAVEIDCGDAGKLKKCFGCPRGNEEEGYVLYESKFADVPDGNLLNYDVAWIKTDSLKVTAGSEYERQFVRISRLENAMYDNLFLRVGIPQGHSTNLDLHVSADLRFPSGFRQLRMNQQSSQRQLEMLLNGKNNISLYLSNCDDFDPFGPEFAPMEEWLGFDILLNLFPHKKILREVTFYSSTKEEEAKIVGSNIAYSDRVDYWKFALPNERDYVDICRFTVSLEPSVPEPCFLIFMVGLILIISNVRDRAKML